MAYKRRLSGEETPTKCYEELVPSFKRMRTAEPIAEQDTNGSQQQHAALLPGHDRAAAGLLPGLSPASLFKSAAHAQPMQPLDQQQQQPQQHQQELHAASLAPMNALLRQLHFERLHRQGDHGTGSNPSS